MSSIVTRRKAADADVSMETGEDGSETRSLRRRSAASGGTPTAVGGDSRRKSSTASDDKEGTPAEKGGMKTRTRTSIGTPPSAKSTRTMVTRERKESPVVDEGGVIYKSRLASNRKRSLTDRESDSVPADAPSAPSKRRRTVKMTEDGPIEKDFYCWLCHKEGENMATCELCPRGFHSKCLGMVPASEDWVCPECEKTMRAECVDTQSKAMMKLSLDQLCMVLNFAVTRLKHAGSKPFQKAVDPSQVPNYKDYIVHPMDIDQIEKNIKQKFYGSTEAFLADVKWILHNCIIFNGVGGKLTAAAKLIVKIAKHETSEVEICPECYLNSYLKKNNNWFCEPCKPPHTLIWAKLKGYPFWPAKALREVSGQVDVRFFGAHDRSWVPVSQVYLLSKEPPVPVKNKKWGFDESMEELQIHISRIKNKFGAFHYSPFRAPYDPKDPYSPEKYRPGKIDIDESATGISSAKKQKLSGAEGKTALKSPPGGVKKFFSKTPLAKRTLKQAMLMKNTTKAASSLKNKYNSLASSRRARLSKTVSAESDKSESETVFRSETDDDTPIGDQLDSIFGKVDDSDSKEEVKAEDVKDESKDTYSEDVVIKTKPDPVHESDPDEEIGGIILSKDQLDTGEKTEFTEMKEHVKKDGTDSESIEDSDVVKTEFAEHTSPDKGFSDEIQNSVATVEQKVDSDGQTADGDILTGEIQESSTKSDESRDSKTAVNSNVQTASKSKETDVLDSAIDGSVDGDKSYNTESDSDLAALRSFSIAMNEVDENESPLVGNADSTSKETSVVADNDITSENMDLTEESLNNNNSIVKDSVNKEKNSDTQDNEEETDKVNASPDTSQQSENREQSSKSEDDKKEERPGIPPTTSGTPKKNPFLENLVESCKAKLGVSPEELKSDLDEDDEDIEDEDKEDSEEEEEEGEDESASESVASEAGTSSDEEGKESHGRESPMEADKKSTSRKMSKRRRSASDILQDLLKKSVENVKARRSSNVSGESSVSSKSSEKSSKSSEKPSEVGSAKRKQPKTKIQDIREKKKLEKEWRERQLQRKREQYEEDKRKEGSAATSPRQSETPVENGKPCPAERSESLVEMTAPNLTNLIKPIDVESTPSPPQIEKAVDSSPSQTPKAGAPDKTMPTLHSSAKESERERVRAGFVEHMVEAATGSFGFEKYIERAMSGVKGVMMDMYKDIVSVEANKAVSHHLQLELERMQWRHQQELQEMKHNFELVLSEQRMLLEHERQQQIENLKKSFMKEREEIIKETKKKQWCANCGKEAMFYCCWNTSYCDYPCQQAHWPKHMATCTQNSANVSGAGAGSGQESSEADSTVNEQNAIWQNAARQMKRQEMERPSSMGQASGPSPVHFMQGSPQMMSGSFNPMSSQPPIRMHNIATYQATPQQMRFGGQNILQPSPMMQQNSQPIVYSLVRPPNMQNPQQPVLISRPGMQGQVIRNPFGYQPGPPSY